MYVVVKDCLRDSKVWKEFATTVGIDLSKPFPVKEEFSGYMYKTWYLPASALTLTSAPLDKSLEDYL